MITLFEEYTKRLTERERVKLMPLLVYYLNKKNPDKENPINNSDIQSMFYDHGHKVEDYRIRKILNVIRLTHSVKRLVANSKGYYICSDKADFEEYIKSLEQREAAISEMKKALIKDYHESLMPGCLFND
jgi:hypothetical protein